MVTSAACISLLAACGGNTGQENLGNTRLLAMALPPAVAPGNGSAGQDGPPSDSPGNADGRIAGPGPGQCPEGKAECSQLDPTLADNFRSAAPR